MINPKAIKLDCWHGWSCEVWVWLPGFCQGMELIWPTFEGPPPRDFSAVRPLYPWILGAWLSSFQKINCESTQVLGSLEHISIFWSLRLSFRNYIWLHSWLTTLKTLGIYKELRMIKVSLIIITMRWCLLAFLFWVHTCCDHRFSLALCSEVTLHPWLRKPYMLQNI